MKQADVRESLSFALAALDDYQRQIKKLLGQDNIAKNDVTNLYGYAEGIASQQRVLEMEVLKTGVNDA